MRPALADRMTVVAIAALLTLWCGSLVLLAATELLHCPPAVYAATGAMLAALAAGADAPGRLARAAQALLSRLRPSGALQAALAAGRTSGASQADARAMTRLQAFSAAVACGCGLLSTGALFLGRWLLGAVLAAFAGSAWEWAVLEFLVAWAALLPMAVGVAMAFLSSAVLRGGVGRDTYATAVREWFWGLAVGLVLLAGALAVEANPLGTCMVAAVGVLAAAALLLQRPTVARRPRQPVRPMDDAPRRGPRLAIAALFALLAAALTGQLRLGQDTAGMGPLMQLLWLAMTVAMLAGGLRRSDARSGGVSPRQIAGVWAGAAAGLLLQGALAVESLGAGPWRWPLLTLAAGAQVPLAYLAAIAVCDRRRRFATDGGRARQFLASAAAGAGIGIAAAYALLACGSCGVLAVAVPLAMMTLGVLRGIRGAAASDEQLRWAAFGAALMITCTAATVLAIRSAGRRLGPVHVGPLATRTAGRPEPGRPGVAWLPAYRSARHEGISAALGDAFSDALQDPNAARRWWSAGTAEWEAPGPYPQGVAIFHAPLQPRFGQEGTDGTLVRPDAGHSHKASLVFLSGPGPGQPLSWRWLNVPMLARWAKQLEPRGRLLLRVQVGRGDGAALARVVASARAVLGSGWAVAGATDDGHLDCLLLGPAETVRRPHRAGSAVVVSFSRLLDVHGPAELLRPAQPGFWAFDGGLGGTDAVDLIHSARKAEPARLRIRRGEQNREPRPGEGP